MLGDNIKKVRKEKGLGIKDIANVVGISEAYVSQIENSKRENPSVDILKSIAESLGVELSDLLDGPDEPFISKENVNDYTVDELELEFERLKPKMRQLPQEEKNKLINIIKIYLEE